MHRWPIALAASLVLATSCGSSHPAAGPPSSADATVSASPGQAGDTTLATSGSSGSTGTTEGSAAADRWDTPCRESYGSTPGAGLAYDGVSDRFGPLGPAPLLDVTLPTVTPTDPDDDGQVRTMASLVNGGAVVAATADTGDPADASVVGLVERSGNRRWVRCLAGSVLDVWVAAPRLQPTAALVAAVPPGGPPRAQWSVLALDTGRDVGGFSDGAAGAGLDAEALAGAGVVAVSPSAVLISHTAQDGGGWAVPDTVARYDLVTGAFASIPAPPGGYGRAELDLGPGDDVVVSSLQGTGVTAVFHDGSWRTDEASRVAARPVTVRFSTGEADGGADPRPLEALDALGRSLWRNAELTDPSLEGMRIATDGAVTVANVCTDGDPGVCNRHEVAGIDTATGAVRWRLPGLRGVAAVADGWALLADAGPLDNDDATTPSAWVLVDDRTGEAAGPSQRWTGMDRFAQGCCGDLENWVEQAGGVVMATASGHLRLWYPMSTDGGPATVSLL